MQSITDLFFYNVDKNSTKCAIWCDGESISYDELGKKVNSYAKLFWQCGIRSNENIGFPMNNSIESVAIMLAAAEIGCALVPINPTLSRSAVEKSFDCGKVKHIIARKNFLKQYDDWDLKAVTGIRICIDNEYKGCVSLSKASSVYSRIGVNKTGDELFIITMTSGSTGNPKPIALTQNNKLFRAQTHINKYKLTDNDRILAATPLYHSLAERLVLIPLMIGATSVLLPRFTPAKWLKCVDEQDVTFTIAVSAQLAQVSELISESFSDHIKSLRCLVSSSALLEQSTKECLINNLSCDFHEMYGTSEISTVTDINFREAMKKKNSVGKPLEGVDIVIRNKEGKTCKCNEVGEITCKTNLVCSGYYGMQELFNNACIDGYFSTGDMGFLDEDGYLYYVSRKKDIIITGGINVYPSDIEYCIMELNGIKECAAFSYPNKLLGETVGVAIVKEDTSVVTRRDIQVHCAKNLADYQQPHEIFFLDELPKNSMGKLVRANILQLVKEEE